MLDGHAVGSGRHAMFAAIDVDARPHLLIEVPEGRCLPRVRPVRALAVSVDRLIVGGLASRLYLDVQCTHHAHDATFAALVSEIVRIVDAAPGDPGQILAAVVERWRAFWAVDPAGMQATDALGLFGELWFLERWMSPMTASVIAAWNGPDSSRHDLQWTSYSVEVKTSSAQVAGGVAHRIASLEQLDDPEQGELLLFSLSVADDALARNTLPVLVERVRSSVTDPSALEMIDARLAAYGYNPAHAGRYNRTLRVISESLYLVSGDFPRLTRSSFDGGVPGGISHVSYAVAMAACSEFRIASAPADDSWLRARSTLA